MIADTYAETASNLALAGDGFYGIPGVVILILAILAIVFFAKRI